MNVQFGQLEIAVHQRGDLLWRRAAALQAQDDLLLPPLTWRPGVAVGHPEQRCVAQFSSWWRMLAGTFGFPGHLSFFSYCTFLGARCSDSGHSLPAASTDVLEPHCGALILGAARIPHRVDIDSQRVTETALHIVRRQIDEEYRQLAVSSSSNWSSSCLSTFSRLTQCFDPVCLSPLSDPTAFDRRAAVPVLRRRADGPACFGKPVVAHRRCRPRPRRRATEIESPPNQW